MIEAAKKAGDANAVRLYTDVQKAFVEAVDGIKHNNIGALFADARQYSSREYQKLDALQWGRDAHKLSGEAAAEQFAAFPDDLKKLARFGWLDELSNTVGSKTKANDLTQTLTQNRQLDLLREMIPRAAGRGPMSTQPERFGDFMGIEKTMIGTRDKVLGNSATAQRLADDARLTRQTLGEMFDRYRSSPSLFAMGMEAVSSGLTKVFGFREDVAQELGRRLFTADRATIDRILARLEANWGADRVGQLQRLLTNTAQAAGSALPAVGARAASENQQQQRQGLLPAR